MTDYRELEQSLHQAAPQADPHFQAGLRRQLLHEFETEWESRSPSPGRRLWQLGVAAVALSLLLLIIGLTPAGQAIAQALIRLGPFLLVDSPSPAEQALTATPEKVYTLRTAVVDPAEASRRAGFTLYYPGYLPPAYIPPDPLPVELVYNRQGEVSAIEVMLFSREQGHILYYSQTPYSPDPDRPPFALGTGDAAATPVAVGSGEGVWLPDYGWGVDSQSRPVLYNVLVWQLATPAGESFVCWLGSEQQLSLEQMLAIARSLSSVGSTSPETLTR